MSAAPVVDADGHVLEPPDGMLRYAPEGWHERVWHVETKADATEWLHFDGGVSPAESLALAGTAGMTATDRERARRGGMRYAEVRPGALNPAPRLPDMRVEGIEQAILYPTMLLGVPGLDDAEFAEVQANAYNEWLAHYCHYAPTRLFGIALVPTQGRDRAVRTIRRARDLGLVGVCMCPTPAARGRRLDDRVHDPIWAVCQELRMPIGLHPVLVPDRPGACRGSDGAGPVDLVESVTCFCAGGICARFPRLTVLFLEANGGWIVPLLERLDRRHAALESDVPSPVLLPSEYFRRQCYVSLDPRESTLAFTASHPLVGAERIVWASGYPRHDARFPGAMRDLARATESLTNAQRQRILGANARDVYRLPAPG